MVESLGKNLSQARLKRGLTIDEVAYATKLRPDKILALENDDYSSFPSNVYAKGFLQIYGRFLKVDVSELSDSLAGTNPISVEDYQYLSNTPPPPKEERSSYAATPQRRGPSLVPLFGFLAMLIVGVFGFQVYVNWNRVNGEPVKKGSPTSGTSNASAVVAATGAAPGPVAPAPAAAPAAVPAPARTGGPVGTVASAGLLSKGPNQTVLRGEVVTQAPVSDRDFVAPTAVAGGPVAGVTPGAVAPTVPAGAVAPVPPTANEVLVQPLKKTWVVVRKNDPNSAPVFEDYLYPDSPALKLRGARFFIKAVDPNAIEIRKNGAPIAYQGPGVEIQ